MKRAPVLPLALLATAWFAGAAASIDWPSEPIDELLRDVAKSRMPALLVFGADWCGYCRKYERQTLASPVIDEPAAGFLRSRFDVDTPDGSEAARRFDVANLPTTLILDADGKPVDRLVGFQTDQQLAAFLQRSHLSATPAEQLLDQALRPETPTDRMLTTARALMDRGRDEEGRALLQRVVEKGAPGSADVCHALMALASLARRSDPPAALPILMRAAGETIDPEATSEAFTAYIDLLRELGRRDEQLAAWDLYAARLPRDPIVQEDTARALIELNAPARKILEAADRAAGLSPEAPGPQASRAQALYQLGRLEDALDAVNRAIDGDRTETSYRVLRLRVLEKLSRKTAGKESAKGRIRVPAKGAG